MLAHFLGGFTLHFYISVGKKNEILNVVNVLKKVLIWFWLQEDYIAELQEKLRKLKAKLARDEVKTMIQNQNTEEWLK